MRWIRNIVREIWGLFVEDGSLAVAILAWIGVVWIVQRWMKPSAASGLILFGGLALILARSVISFARQFAIRSQTKTQVTEDRHISS
jgi:hypothetical protein